MPAAKRIDQRPAVALPEAAHQAKKSWAAMYGAILRGEVNAHQREGRWYVDAADLKRYLRERAI